MLSRVLEPTTTLAIWERQPPRALLDGMARLCPAHLPQGRALVWLPDVPAALTAMLSGTPIGLTPLGVALHADILALVSEFAVIAGTDVVDIRLDRLAHDACWKFHRDHVHLRLLATYRGPATQIVPDEQAETALREQRAYRGPLEDVPEGAVALFKGARGSPGQGAVHRSPPIKGTGMVRSVLCLNLPSEASPRLWQP
ncbi:DUF1826 domain-containing protein [Niveispirillum irakense]|uniref:DUF1826 domain-containing protein n=1 Tax=Niveispirillum irakense TaxID=34011 RepID=UPI001378DFB1|nr:DUF1826 domain-containing protein [Niveispirillum irakense]